MDPNMNDSVDLLSTWSSQKNIPPIDRTISDKKLTAIPGGKPGPIIGTYQMTRRLGKGEFAEVWECKVSQNDIHDIRACKAIRKERVQRASTIHKSKRNIKRVNMEIDALRRCKHAAICQVYGVFHSPLHVYIICEKGERDLYSFLDGYPSGCEEDVIRNVMRLVALGMRHCHNAGIAHRDIKPENILVNGCPSDWIGNGNGNTKDSGIVKICDFGLCADITGGTPLTDFVGSPGFFAPELLLAKSYDGGKADIWSIGAVMLEMLLGHEVFANVWFPAYDDLSESEFRTNVTETLQQLRDVKAECPSTRTLPILVDQLLHMDPNKRSPIGKVCETEYFGLLTTTTNGMKKMLRLTYDQARASFGEKGPTQLRPVQRRKRITLSRIVSGKVSIKNGTSDLVQNPLW